MVLDPDLIIGVDFWGENGADLLSHIELSILANLRSYGRINFRLGINLIFISFRLKQRGQVADMNTIIEAVHQDWSSLVNRIKNETPELEKAVHSALGALIKQRKIYYTGNKGTSINHVDRIWVFLSSSPIHGYFY